MSRLDAPVAFLVPQKDIVDDDPAAHQLYELGTVVRIKQVLRSKNEGMRVLVTGLYRGKIERFTATEPCMYGRIALGEEKKSVLTYSLHLMCFLHSMALQQ